METSAVNALWVVGTVVTLVGICLALVDSHARHDNGGPSGTEGAWWSIGPMLCLVVGMFVLLFACWHNAKGIPETRLPDDSPLRLISNDGEVGFLALGSPNRADSIRVHAIPTSKVVLKVVDKPSEAGEVTRSEQDVQITVTEEQVGNYPPDVKVIRGQRGGTETLEEVTTDG